MTTPVQNAQAAVAQAATLWNACDLFARASTAMEVADLQRFVDTMQHRFASAQTAMTAIASLADKATLFRHALTDQQVDVEAAFTSARTAGQAVVAEYATNVLPLRALDSFDINTGLHVAATISAADLADMRAAAGALRDALTPLKG